jgi:hypothetical protein
VNSEQEFITQAKENIFIAIKDGDSVQVRTCFELSIATLRDSTVELLVSLGTKNYRCQQEVWVDVNKKFEFEGEMISAEMYLFGKRKNRSNKNWRHSNNKGLPNNNESKTTKYKASFTQG